MQSRDFQQVSEYLKTLNINCPSYWLSEFINDYKRSKSNASPNELSSAVYKHLLTTNLRDVKTSSLPSNVKSHDKIVLNGQYFVQVESMINSAKSSYSEFQRIKGLNTDLESSEKQAENVNTKRCLTFHMTDGVQEIEAMEYQPIPNIRLNDPQFLPGFKMLIKGPVVCRKGMILLKQENVKVYGGKVDALCETNCLELLLCRKLGLDADSVSVKAIDSNSERQADQDSQLNSLGDENNCNELDEFFSDNNDMFLNVPIENNDVVTQSVQSQACVTGNNSSKSTKQQKISTFFNTTPKGNNNSKFTTNNQFGKFSRSNDVSTFSNKRAKLDLDDYSSNVSREIRNENVSESKQCNYFDDDMDIIDDLDFDSPFNLPEQKTMEQKFEDIEIISHIDNNSLSDTFSQNSSMGQPKKTFPISVDKFPFVYLKQISSMKFSKSTTFIVKAIILTLKSKISLKNDEFALRACISDGSHTVLVDFSSPILEDILEYSPCEIAALMSERSKNSAVMDRIKKIFSVAQQKLLSMNCLMEIVFHGGDSVPCVVKLEEVQMRHVNALRERNREFLH